MCNVYGLGVGASCVASRPHPVIHFLRISRTSHMTDTEAEAALVKAWGDYQRKVRDREAQKRRDVLAQTRKVEREIAATKKKHRRLLRQRGWPRRKTWDWIWVTLAILLGISTIAAALTAGFLLYSVPIYLAVCGVGIALFILGSLVAYSYPRTNGFADDPPDNWLTRTMERYMLCCCRSYHSDAIESVVIDSKV